MNFPDGLTARLLLVLLLVFMAGQIVSWRVFRFRQTTAASTLKWSFIAALCGFLTMLILVVAIALIGPLAGHPLDLDV